MRTIVYILFAASSLLVNPVFSAELSKQFDACIEKSSGGDAEMLECNSNEWKVQDKRLNAAYKKLNSQLSAAKRKELQEVQRAWIKYTDAKCAFYWDAQEFNGTADRLNAATCTTTERARRAEELEQLIDR